ncbi:MAG TPA: hypothetical protein VF677_02545 [Flavobacterium sp.]|jgi:hypothetical protein
MKNFIITIAFLGLISCFEQDAKKTNMNKELIQFILNNQNGLHPRIMAIKNIDLSAEKTSVIITELTKILSREKSTVQTTIDWDPVAEERVIDLYIIEVLNKLGDKSENNRIPILVSQAIPFMREFGDERKEDAKIIKSINDEKLYGQIINLVNSSNPKVLENAVITLNNINFLNAPVGGDITYILSAEKIKFKFSHLKEEMELYTKESQGKIELSNGVKTFIIANNRQLANDNEFIENESSLIHIVENIFYHGRFDYYIENNKVIICTHAESAKRWQDWWILTKKN